MPCIETTLMIKKTLNALIALKSWVRPITIKVFQIDEMHKIIPPMLVNNDDIRKIEIARKHITFDIYANGLCVAGQAIPEASTIFASADEFVEISRLIWGAEINELIQAMQGEACFSAYPQLIKKVLRLASYVNFNINSFYYGTTQDCYHSACKSLPCISAMLTVVYPFLTTQFPYHDAEQAREIRQALFAIANYLMNYSHA